MGGFGGGFLQGFADSYAKEHKAKLDRNLAQRGQLADLGMRALQESRPEAQLQIITNLSRLISADPNKKLDKDLMDIGSWLGPPQGYGQTGEPTPAPRAFTSGSEMVPSSGGGAASALPPAPLRGAGMAAVPGIGGGGPSRGMSLPVPPEALRAPEYRMTSQEGSEPLAGLSPFAAPPPPAWSPFYSAEEKSQMAAAQAAQLESAKGRAEYGVRKENMPGGMSTQDQARWMAGGQPLLARLQTKDFTDKKGQTVRLSFDNLTNTYYDNSNNEVNPDDLGYTPLNYSSAATTPFRAFWQSKMAAGSNPQDAIDEWNTTNSMGSHIALVQQADGNILPVEVQTQSTRTRGGVTAEPPPPLRPSKPGEAVGGKALPPVTKAFETYNSAIERYDVMEDAYDKALHGDQQAMLNLLANHIGMTMGLQRGARITQAMYDEALQSSPWLANFAARFDNNGEFSVNPADYRNGVVLPKGTMRQMIDLAKVRRDADEKAYRRTQDEAGRGFKPPTASPAGAEKKPGKMVKMRAPGKDGKPGAEQDVPADQVEFYKSKGAVVVQ